MARPKRYTDEELKAKKRASDKAYSEANKEKINLQKKAYYKANKESIAIKRKSHYEVNKEAISIQKKTYKETKRLPHHIVYCLPKYNKHGYIKYAGVTDNPTNRMHSHKSNGNNVDEWFVLHACKNRKEAEEVEAEYHEKGYAGKKGFQNI